MAISIGIKRREDGSMIEAASCGWDIEEPCVTVPVSVINSHSDQALMEWIRDSCQYAEKAAAIEFAGWLVQSNADETVLKTDADSIARLQRFAGTDDRIDAAIARLDLLRARSEFRNTTKGKRRELASNYDITFLSIGRRDGFHCQHCGATSDLTIDHITPLVRGGSNELDNLQFLCKSCNSRKGDK